MRKIFKFSLMLLMSMTLGLVSCEKNPNGGDNNGGGGDGDGDGIEKSILVYNCAKEPSTSGVGATGGKATFVAVTKLSAEQLATGGSKYVKGLRLGITAPATACKAFIRDSKEGNNLAEATFEYSPSGWSVAKFDQPFEIPAETELYFGYEMTTEGYALGYSGKGRSTDEIALNGQWTKLSSVIGNRGYLAIQAILTGGDYSAVTPQNDLYLLNVPLTYNVMADASSEIKAYVSNEGVNPVNNITVEGTYNGQAFTKEFNDVKMACGDVMELSLGMFTAPSERGTITVKVTAKDKDNTDEATSNNTVSTKQMVNIGGYPLSMVLIEQFTGQACPNCPAGGESLKSAIAGMQNPDKICWVAHHSGYYPDDFTLNEDKEIASAFGVNAAPMSIVNRSPFQFDRLTMVGHPGYITTAQLDELAALEAPASINLDHTYNAETRELTVTVSGDTKVEEMNLTVIVMQSGIKATQSGASGDYEHNYVPRVYMTAALGDKVDVASGKYTKTLTATLPETVGKYDLVEADTEVVAFITAAGQSTQNSYVLNAIKKPLAGGSKSFVRSNATEGVASELAIRNFETM